MKKILNLLVPALTIATAGFYKISPAKPTVASALAGFQKIKNDLAKVKAHHDAEAVKHAQVIEATKAEYDRKVQAAQAEYARKVDGAGIAALAAEAEAARAARALVKVEDFLS